MDVGKAKPVEIKAKSVEKQADRGTQLEKAKGSQQPEAQKVVRGRVVQDTGTTPHEQKNELQKAFGDRRTQRTVERTERTPEQIKRNASEQWTTQQAKEYWKENPPKTKGEEAAQFHSYPPAEPGYHHRYDGTKFGTQDPREPVYVRNPVHEGRNPLTERGFVPAARRFMDNTNIPDIKAVIVKEEVIYLSERPDSVNGNRQEINVGSETPTMQHNRNELESLFAKRTEQVGTRDTLQAQEKTPGLTEVQQKQLHDVKNDIQDSSRQIGENAGEYYARSQGYERVFPPRENWPSRPHEFDQIWKKGDDKYLVIEAKGGTDNYKEIGVKRVDGLIVEQGTKEYFRDTVERMIDKGYDVGTELQKAYMGDKTSVEYVKVKGVIGESAVKKIEVDHFDKF